MLLSEKVFVVTGGGSGIGEAAVKRLASEGARVVVADVDEAGGTRVVKEVAATGGQAAFVRTDVSREADADAMVRFALDTYGRLDGAVNNAGVGQPVMRIHELETKDWDRVHGVDLRGVFFCMRAELRHFFVSGGGVIVNTSSASGVKATYGQGSYVAAKHGVIGLTRQAAIEYAAHNIRVNAIAPGAVATPQFLAQPEDAQKVWAATQPGGRVAEPREIANAIAWLLSNEASFVSGDTLLIDAASMQK